MEEADDFDPYNFYQKPNCPDHRNLPVVDVGKPHCWKEETPCEQCWKVDVEERRDEVKFRHYSKQISTLVVEPAR